MMNEQKTNRPQQNKNIQQLLQQYNKNRKPHKNSSSFDGEQQKRSGLSSVLLVVAFILYAVSAISLLVLISDTNSYLMPLISCSSALPSALLFHALSRILFLLENK